MTSEAPTAVQRVIHNLPQVNVSFQPRHSLQLEISSTLDEGHCIVVSGPGGNGKSQIAKDYAHHALAAQKYELIWRMEARNETEIDAGYRELAAALSIKESASMTLAALIGAVQGRITMLNLKTWLLIFDDAKVEESFMKVFSEGLPLHGGGNILITSRSPHWQVKVIHVSGFSDTEAHAFVAKMLPWCTLDHASLLCKALGNHPLALSQACGYLAKTKMRINLYITAYQNSHRLRSAAEMPAAMDGYGHTVEATVEIAVAELTHDAREPSQHALWLLECISFLSAQPVSMSFLTVILAQYLEGDQNEELTVQIMRACLDYGFLIQLEQNNTVMYQMHELTSDVLRTRVAVELHNVYRMAIIRAGIELYNWDLVPTLAMTATRASTLQHIEHVCAGWRSGRPIPDHRSISQMEQADWGEVIFIYRQLSNFVTSPAKKVIYCLDELQLSEAVFGPHHLATANALDSLGTAYSEKSDHSKAIECYLRSLEIYLQTVGKNHINTATSYNNIGSALDSNGEFDKAIEYFLKSITIKRALLGENDPEVATGFDNIGASYHSKGNYKTAIEYYQKALVINLDVLGPDHPDTAVTYNHLGGVHDTIGQYDKAIEFYEKDLLISLATIGEEHPDTAACYNNLGSAYDSKGEYDRAIEYYEKDRKICLATLGPDHPETAISYSNAGISYFHRRRNNDLDIAIEYCQLAVDVDMAVVGHDHPDTVITCLKLARVLSVRDPARSIELCKSSLPVIHRCFGDEHARVATAHLIMGLAYRSLGQFDHCIPELEAAVAMYQACLGREHDDTADAMCDLGLAYLAINDTTRALGLLQDARDILQRCLGASHPKVARAQAAMQEL